MLKHIVLLPLDSANKHRVIDEVFELLDSLKQALPGIMSFSHGEHCEKEQEYTYAYTMDFVDEEYYQNFIKHEDQKTIQNKIKDALIPASQPLVFNYNLV